MIILNELPCPAYSWSKFRYSERYSPVTLPGGGLFPSGGLQWFCLRPRDSAWNHCASVLFETEIWSKNQWSIMVNQCQSAYFPWNMAMRWEEFSQFHILWVVKPQKWWLYWRSDRFQRGVVTTSCRPGTWANLTQGATVQTWWKIAWIFQEDFLPDQFVGQSQQLNSKNGTTFETDSKTLTSITIIIITIIIIVIIDDNSNNSNNSNSDNNNDNNKNNNKINNYI